LFHRAAWLPLSFDLFFYNFGCSQLSALNLVSHHVYTVDANDELLTALEIMNGNGTSVLRGTDHWSDLNAISGGW
jgi:hypothetical protein